MTARTTGSRSSFVLLQYLALAATWGSSFLFIKLGLEGLSPAQVVLARMTLGTLALAAVLLVRRQPLPRDPVVWGHLAVVAVLLCVAPFLLFAWAELRLPSGLASILNATTPLMTMLVASLALRDERLGRARTAGLLLGFAGVVIVFAPWTQGATSLLGSDLPARAACLGATLSYGVAFVWLRRFVAPRGLPAVSTAFVQVGLGTVVLIVLAPWMVGTPVHPTPRTVGAMVALGVLGTGLAYVWNTNVVNAWGAVRASTVTYLAPLVGVLAGVVFLGESVTAASIVGGVIIVSGVITGHNAWKPLLAVLAGAGSGRDNAQPDPD